MKRLKQGVGAGEGVLQQDALVCNLEVVKMIVTRCFGQIVA